MSETLIGYTDALSVRAGGQLGFKLSSRQDCKITLALHRVVGLRWGQGGPQPQLEHAPHPANGLSYPCGRQPIHAGSYGQAPAPPDLQADAFSFGLWIRSPGREKGRAALMSLSGQDGDLTLGLRADGRVALSLNGAERAVTPEAVRPNVWTAVLCQVGAAGCRVILCEAGKAPSEASGPAVQASVHEVVSFAARLTDGTATDHFSGRLAQPTIAACPAEALLAALLGRSHGRGDWKAACLAAWDFSEGIQGQTITDTGPSRCDGWLINRPTRAVTGPFWTGEVFAWQQAPAQYDAIHFHRDDLDDCGWDTTLELAIPEAWAPGLYAAELSTGAALDLIPFVVRSAKHNARPRLAILLPTFTYLSYGNARNEMRGPDFGVASYADEETLAAHPKLGRSQYDLHGDRSPVMFSSPRRPLLSMRLNVRPWGLPVDAALIGFLEHLGVDYDILTDGDLHSEGYRALHRYSCVLTGNHPEYYSREMLNGLEAFTRRGGRLAYLGGNGFYWRVSVCPEVGTIEVRRAEDGTRAWIAAPGEAYHAMDGQYGGLWRRLGRPPNALVDVGFAAQGDFEHSGFYRIRPGARDGLGAFALKGVRAEAFGDFGWLGGGAAGQEIDRADPANGTDPAAEVLASSTGHTPAMMRTIEEMLSTVPPFDDPKVRADVTFRALSGGGAVFSVGSMTWNAALDHNSYRNDVARITENVIRRFLDPAPFEAKV